MQCPVCKGLVKTDKSGDTYCTSCGTIFDTQGKRTAIAPEVPKRTSLYKLGMKKRKATLGAEAPSGIAPSKRYKARRLSGMRLTREDIDGLKAYKRLEARHMLSSHSSIDRTERNFMDAMRPFNLVCSAIGLPKEMKETASMIYRYYISKGATKGRDRYGVAMVICSIVLEEAAFAERRMLDSADIGRAIEKLGLTKRQLASGYGAIFPSQRHSNPRNNAIPALIPIFDYIVDNKLPQGIFYTSNALIDKFIKRKKRINQKTNAIAAAVIYRTLLDNDLSADRAEIAKHFKVSDRSMRRMDEELKR